MTSSSHIAAGVLAYLAATAPLAIPCPAIPGGAAECAAEVTGLPVEVAVRNDDENPQEDPDEGAQAHRLPTHSSEPRSSFSWQFTQYRAQGTAFSRCAPIGSWQWSQVPYWP